MFLTELTALSAHGLATELVPLGVYPRKQKAKHTGIYCSFSSNFVTGKMAFVTGKMAFRR